MEPITSLSSDPEHVFRAAIDLYGKGMRPEAEAACTEFLEAQPGHLNATLFRGFLRLDLGQPLNALADFDQVLALASDHAEALGKRGNALLALGRFSESLSAFDRALALDPGLSEVHCNRASVLLDLGCPEEALASAEAALVRAPDHPDALSNRASALERLGRSLEALACTRQVLARQPQHWAATLNQAISLQSLGRYNEALAAFDLAVGFSPAAPEARAYRGLLRLLLGQWKEGWIDAEARLGLPALAPGLRPLDARRWEGQALDGARILLHADQGLGDTIFFSRWIPLVTERGGRVVFEVQDPLLPLFRRMGGVAELRARGDCAPATDFHCPLGSLPRVFGTTLDSIPRFVPYVWPPKAALARWEERLRLPGRRVGLVWAGNPANGNDRRRSMLLDAFLPLLDLPGITFVALQKDLGEREQALLAKYPGVVVAGPGFQDFGDTAAAISQLDLVISVDTSVAHLTGALGRPLWILLPHQPDWRWLLHREDTPWYPSARLFRQTRPGEWGDPIARVVRALRTRTSGSVGGLGGEPPRPT
jgi:tetratricopeptide (TPR) repeat protein